MDDKALSIIGEMEGFTTTEAALSMVPETLQKPYKNIPEEYHDMTDEQLENVVRPSQVDRLLKIKFWKEIDRITKEQRETIKVMNVYDGVCSRAYFYNNFLKDEGRVAYFYRKPITYEDMANELIEYGLQRLRNEVLPARIIFEDSGHIDSKGVKVLLELIQYLDLRTKGSVVQKHQVESKSMHVNVDAKDVGGINIQDEIKKIQMQIAQAKGAQLVEGLPERVVVDVNQEKDQVEK